MGLIQTQLLINAPAERCFDLARSIDVHQVSASRTGEKAIAGKTSGLISQGETVTWRARHFGIWQELTAKITEFEPPHRFVDEMVAGAFRHFYHEHRFEAKESGTLMTDTFEYSVPYGLAGKLFDRLILHCYMKRFLTRRNQVIRELAESKTYLLYT